MPEQRALVGVRIEPDQQDATLFKHRTFHKRRVCQHQGNGLGRIEGLPIGIQVIGYGDYTTYMYPGGLNLGQIAPVPPH